MEMYCARSVYFIPETTDDHYSSETANIGVSIIIFLVTGLKY